MSETPTIQQNEQTKAVPDNLTTPEYFKHYGEIGVETESSIRQHNESSAGLIDLYAPDAPFSEIISDDKTVPHKAVHDYLQYADNPEFRFTDQQNIEAIRSYTTNYVVALRKHYVLTA